MRWWFSRSKASESRAETEESHDSEAPPLHPVAARLLDLQRTVGNQAVQEMIGSPEPEIEPSSETQLLRQPSTQPAETAQADQEVKSLEQSVGEPLDPEVQQQMELRFGEDFSDVRVHTDEKAASSAAALGATAYTIARDVYFAPGMYAPQTPEGRRLLAHELTHVVQEDQASSSPATENELSEPTDVAEREAEEVAEAVERGQRAPAIASAGKGMQRDVGWAQRGPLPDPYGTLLLLNAFAAKFLDAAKLIYKNPAAMKLVNEAEAAGIQFGGYAEDGPGKRPWAYTIGNTVYVPRAQTDPVLAMNNFLFELNNALRAPKFAELHKEAAKGAKGSLTAKAYAHQIVEQEVEGMLRLGEIWFEMKKTMAKGTEFDKYDSAFYLAEYKAFREGKKTKDDIVKDVLNRVRGHEPHPEWTVEEYYMDDYKSLSGGK